MICRIALSALTLVIAACATLPREVNSNDDQILRDALLPLSLNTNEPIMVDISRYLGHCHRIESNIIFEGLEGFRCSRVMIRGNAFYYEIFVNKYVPSSTIGYESPNYNGFAIQIIRLVSEHSDFASVDQNTCINFRQAANIIRPYHWAIIHGTSISPTNPTREQLERYAIIYDSRNRRSKQIVEISGYVSNSCIYYLSSNFW